MTIHRLHIISFVILTFLVNNKAMSQEFVWMAAESRIWLEGSSSVNTFTCVSETVEAGGYWHAVEQTTTGSLTVPVMQLSCGKKRMDADLFEALQATQHPFISYVVDSVRIQSIDLLEESYELVSEGLLSIAGAVQPLTVTFTGQTMDETHYRLTGSQSLQMSAFGISPPTALFGLIKTKDIVEIHFNLLVRLEDFHSSNHNGTCIRDKDCRAESVPQNK